MAKHPIFWAPLPKAQEQLSCRFPVILPLTALNLEVEK